MNPPDLGVIAAAARLGCTADEYKAAKARGERWCCDCGAWHPLHDGGGRPMFGRDRSRSDGLARRCLAADAAAHRRARTRAAMAEKACTDAGLMLASLRQVQALLKDGAGPNAIEAFVRGQIERVVCRSCKFRYAPGGELCSRCADGRTP